MLAIALAACGADGKDAPSTETQHAEPPRAIDLTDLDGAREPAPDGDPPESLDVSPDPERMRLAGTLTARDRVTAMFVDGLGTSHVASVGERIESSAGNVFRVVKIGPDDVVLEREAADGSVRRERYTVDAEAAPPATTRAPPAASTPLDQLELKAIVRGKGVHRAMVLDEQGAAHVLRRGDTIGEPEVEPTAQGRVRHTWKVASIRSSEVVLQREPSPTGSARVTRVLSLN